MTLVMTLLIIYLTGSIITTAIGSFLGNFGLLWLIGRKAQEAEKERIKFLRSIQEERVKSNLKRREEYLKMES